MKIHTTKRLLSQTKRFFRVIASSDAERDARSFLQMPSTRQLAATAVLAVTTAVGLWMLMRKKPEMESSMLANRTACASFGSPILVVAQATIC
jgi:GH25 family lysozyme M1 (1,4-beta-N-acetylmuramidase)